MIDADCFKTLQEGLKATPNYDCIELHIDSFGGYVYQAKQVYSFLKKEQLRGIEIKTIGYAMIYSAATIIFMAGSVRVLQPYSEFLIHLPVSGNLEMMNVYELRDYVNELEKDTTNFVALYSELTNIATETILGYLKENKAWNSARALKEGFATEIDTTVSTFAKQDKRNAVAIWGKENEGLQELIEQYLNSNMETNLMAKIFKMFARTKIDRFSKSMVLSAEDGTKIYVYSEDGSITDKNVVFADEAGLPTETVMPDGTYNVQTETGDTYQIVVASGVVLSATESVEMTEPEAEAEAEAVALIGEAETVATIAESVQMVASEFQKFSKAVQEQLDYLKNAILEKDTEIADLKDFKSAMQSVMGDAPAKSGVTSPETKSIFNKQIAPEVQALINRK